jgi:Tfp pilus assembly protein PilX
VADDAPRAERRREAAAALADAEREYLRALAEYAETASAEDADPVTRLATLEGLVRSTRYALERAPEDPVINGYHLAAVRERDDLRRQMAQTEADWF